MLSDVEKGKNLMLAWLTPAATLVRSHFVCFEKAG